jgi:hypothetical protein
MDNAVQIFQVGFIAIDEGVWLRKNKRVNPQARLRVPPGIQQSSKAGDKTSSKV